MQMQKQPCIRHLHLQLVCLGIQFLLDLTAFPREIEDIAHAEFWEANEVYYGRCANGE